MRSRIALLIVLVLLLAACAQTPQAEPTEAFNPEVILATTTSTRDSGLLDALLPVFQEQTGYAIKMVAVGTGEALKMGSQGDADVLLVHAPAAEVDFMESGAGAGRYLVMHNDFILVGPVDDPAGVGGMATAAEALAQVAASQANFVTRGDDSGTHKKELSLWQEAGVEPSGAWYLETGQGMGASLRVADEKDAYILTDRATYLAQVDTLSLEILVEGEPGLRNVYHVITVNPEKFEGLNAAGGQAFADFLVAPATQELIGQFGLEQFGQALFVPDAGKTEAELGSQ